MRILHIVDGIPPLVLGGTGRIVLEIAQGQVRMGHTVAILSAAKDSGTVHNVQLLAIPPRAERWAHWRCVLSSSRGHEVLAQIESFKPDLVHAHTISRQIGYRWMPAMKKSGKKLIVTCHDVSHIAYGKILPGKAPKWWQDSLKHRWTWNPLRSVMIRSYLKSADRILTVSDALKTELASHNFPPMQTVHNGIDLNFWKPSVAKADARKKLNLPENKFLFLLAGRMGYDKGSTLIAATLPKEADLVLAGDRFSNEFAAVKDRMHIFYNQTAEEMKLQYAAADVVLVPSRCLDCFPTVCLEAMAMERPVMATSWGGAKESVLDGLTGWILDPMDERAWQQKMLWCLKNSADCVQTGLAGRKRMQEYFGLPMMLEKLEKIYAL